MFSSIFAEIKKIKENFEFITREEREARKGGKGCEPIFRMVEAERVHANLLYIIPASIILFLVEICGMIWAFANKIDFDYAGGFLISCVIFTVISLIYIIVIEKRLRDPDFSLKQKKIIYRSFWVIFSISAMSFSIMELLDRGTVNNFLCFVFLFTVLPVIEPFSKTLVLVATFLIEDIIMVTAKLYDPDILLLCFVAVLIASVASYIMFLRYMNTKITEKRLEHFANGDQLTMLTNRRGFVSLAPELKKYCEKNSLKLLVIMVDIDDFKKYNDTYGHLEGDICLKNVAARIRENFSRSTDICARYGGEEFIVLSAFKDDEKIIGHIKQLRADIENTYNKGGSNVTVSLGVCITDSPAKVELEYLIKAADEELYNAKLNGKNCLSYNGVIYKN